MFFIAAPFGNYLKSNRPAGWDVLSVSGTWTLKPRPGRFKQILKTLRYTKDGWVNKLGLKNQGIEESNFLILKYSTHLKVMVLYSICKF